MANKSIFDPIHWINTRPANTAALLNQLQPIQVTQTDTVYLQRTLNTAVHFAKAYLQQKPDDFMLWAEAWGQCMQYLEVRFGLKEPSYKS